MLCRTAQDTPSPPPSVENNGGCNWHRGGTPPDWVIKERSVYFGLSFRRTPHPVIVAIRDNKDYTKVL